MAIKGKGKGTDQLPPMRGQLIECLLPVLNVIMYSTEGTVSKSADVWVSFYLWHHTLACPCSRQRCPPLGANCKGNLYYLLRWPLCHPWPRRDCLSSGPLFTCQPGTHRHTDRMWQHSCTAFPASLHPESFSHYWRL